MKKIFLTFLAFLLILISLTTIKADVYVGTCEGYVRNTEGQFVQNAFVRATVNKCIVQCSQETTTESTGYYVVANLNLPKKESLTVYAEKSTPLGLEFGSASGLANDYQAAYVNVTICLPPPAPTLIDEPNTHDTSVKLEWTSYADKKGYSTYDEFQIDSRAIVKSNNPGVKNIDVSNLDYRQHTWQVRTCNPFCCSVWVSDSFNVGNLRPLPPNLTDQPDTAPGFVSLNWTSGIDPDGDKTYDEYCFGIVNEETCILDAKSPIEEEVFCCHYYLWKVRTCELESQRLCSLWSEDGFIVCAFDCPQCSCPPCICGGGSGGGGVGGGVGGVNYALTIISPPSVDEGTYLPLDIRLTAWAGASNILFRVNSPDFNFNDYIISKMESSKARLKLTGKTKETTKPGIYNLTLDVFISNTKIFSETFEIRVKKPLFIGITKLVKEIPKRKYTWLIILIIIILLASLITYLKIREKKKSVKFSGKGKHLSFLKPRT